MVTRAIDESQDDRLDCYKLEPRQVDFHYLVRIFNTSSWDEIHDCVLKQLAHWHCRMTVLYFSRWIRRTFQISACEFQNICVVKLGEALRKEAKAFLGCENTDEIVKLARTCIKRSCQNAHYYLKRQSKRSDSMTRLPNEIEEPVKETSSLNDEDMVICLNKLELIEQVIIKETARGTSVEEIGKIVGQSPGNVSRRKHKAITKLRQCLGIVPRE